MSFFEIPVLRQGNIIELMPLGAREPKRLAVVEACSGIRSLMTLVTLAVVYAYFTRPKQGPTNFSLSSALTGKLEKKSDKLKFIGQFAFWRSLVLIVAAVPIAFLSGLLRTRLARASVANLVLELGAAREPEEVRDALRGALGDPSLWLAYWLSERNRWVDISGWEIDLEAESQGRKTAFVEHDGFQCGFCTSGQIMSGVAMIEEAKAGWPSAATTDLSKRITVADLSELEVRERMSGNLCRCACYPNIVAAIAEATRRV